jgi:hypothetical protein
MATRSVSAVAALAVLVTLGGCTAAKQPAPPAAVAIPASGTIADFGVYRPGTWLTVEQLLFGILRWKLTNTARSARTRALPLTNSCGTYDWDNDQYTRAGPSLSAVSGDRVETFVSDRQKDASATETQWFFTTTAEAANAFTAYADRFGFPW